MKLNKMKAELSVVLSLALVTIAFTGCKSKGSDTASSTGEVIPALPTESGQSVTPTEAASSDSAGMQTNGSTADQLYPQDQDNSIDLDGDGTADTIYYNAVYGADDLEPTVTLKINDLDFSDLLNGDYCLINPETSYFFAGDLDSSNSSLELGFVDYGPSNDEITTFFRFDGTNLTCLGSVPGYPEEYCELSDDFSSDVSFQVNGDGTIDTNYLRLNILQTWFASATYELDDSQTFVLKESELYYPTDYNPMADSDEEYNVTLLETLPIYGDYGDVNATTTELQPQKVKFTATDNKNWCQLEAEDGTTGWFYITDFDTIDALGKSAGEVFDGLCQCD